MDFRTKQFLTTATLQGCDNIILLSVWFLTFCCETTLVYIRQPISYPNPNPIPNVGTVKCLPWKYPRYASNVRHCGLKMTPSHTIVTMPLYIMDFCNAITRMLDRWTDYLECGGQIDAVYTDFEKVFDKVPHRRLIYKLYSVYRWFAQSTICASARNIHKNARIISYIARIIRSQHDNIVHGNANKTNFALSIFSHWRYRPISLFYVLYFHNSVLYKCTFYLSIVRCWWILIKDLQTRWTELLG